MTEATAVRVVLPAQLRSLSGAGREVALTLGPAPTQRQLFDALEARYPVLRGTIRDPSTCRRRAFLRLFAGEEDVSHQAPDEPLPAPVAAGWEPLVVVTAIAGG